MALISYLFVGGTHELCPVCKQLLLQHSADLKSIVEGRLDVG